MNRFAKIAAGAAAATSALGFNRARRRAQLQARQTGEGAAGGLPAEGGDATPKPPEDLAAERLKQRLDESRERLKSEIPPPE